jgi:phospholipid N-methyltransferase
LALARWTSTGDHLQVSNNRREGSDVTETTQTSLKIEYRFDNDWFQARERLAAIEAGSDPVTIRHLEALGVGEGWHCLEVGGGGGSITEWLCRRVGSSRRVVATDVNPRFLEALDFPNFGGVAPQHR